MRYGSVPALVAFATAPLLDEVAGFAVAVEAGKHAGSCAQACCSS
jgi:hypothetical protein